MSGVLADLRHAFRLYAKTPASSAFAIAGLAAALAIETAFLSLSSVLELTPHAGFEARRNLVTIAHNDGGRASWPLTLEIIERIDTEATTIESVAGITSARQTLDRDDETLEVATELVTAPSSKTSGPAVLLGRPFSRTDHAPDAAPLAIVSYKLWQRELGGRENVLGESLRIRGRSVLLLRRHARSGARLLRHRRARAAHARHLYHDVDVWLPFEQVWLLLGEGRPTNAMRSSCYSSPPPGFARRRAKRRGSPSGACRSDEAKWIGLDGRHDSSFLPPLVATFAGHANAKWESGRTVIKRWFDVLSAFIALVVLSPLLLLIAYAIKCDDGGPALFTQIRIGKRKRPFCIYKFRTMRDGRVIRVGAWLRSTGLDELPQLVNVLRGDMSIIGPRPLTPADVERLGWHAPAYAVRWSVAPGIVGLAQLYAGRGARLSWFLDRCYVTRRTRLSMDAAIVVLSAGIALVGKRRVRRWLRARHKVPGSSLIVRGLLALAARAKPRASGAARATS